jgi:hypothetical protein
MSGTRGRLYSCETLLERLPQDLEDMAAALGLFIWYKRIVVRSRYLGQNEWQPAPPVVKNFLRPTMLPHPPQGASRESRPTFFTKLPMIRRAFEMIEWGM